MPTYISMLRGINVSGRNMIKMSALRKSYEEMGLRDVKTYLQSGNVIFTCDKATGEELQREITNRIEKDFGLGIPVFVLTIDRLKQIIHGNPFIKEADINTLFLHITFLSSATGEYNREAIEGKKQQGERIAFSEAVVYLYCPNGYGNTKLNNNFLEAQLKTTATTRNWKTANELVRIAENTK